MNEVRLEPTMTSRTDAQASKKKRSGLAFTLFIIFWLGLIGGGIYGAKIYTEQMQETITSDIQEQTAIQIAEMQQIYDARIEQVESNYLADMTALNNKIDALNQLLTFTKDNADNNTDNSNKLYSQLNDVKIQLDELKKNLDVLK